MLSFIAVITGISFLCATVTAQPPAASQRLPLSYVPAPPNLYEPAKAPTTVTLLELIDSRPELSVLSQKVRVPAGFSQALDTEPTWSFTFFAPSNTAFNNTGQYYNTFAATPKGQWAFGNQLAHHYVPNSVLKSTSFNSTETRLQSGVFLFISAQAVNGKVLLNNVATITEADIPVTSGVVHIIDHVLDPSAQIFNEDLPWISQTFIAGSCSNTNLPYC